MAHLGTRTIGGLTTEIPTGRHRFVATYIYDLPFFSRSYKALKFAFANWQLNGITTMQSGCL